MAPRHRPDIEMRSPRCYIASAVAPDGTRRSTKEDDVLSYLHDAVRDQTAPGASMSGAPIGPTSDLLLERIHASLENDKAEDVVTIDLRGKSEIADYMVIATGRSTRQVAAISDKLVERLKDELGIRSKVEGKEAADWVLIDAGDVIVHVFRPEVREFYQLEKMWLSPAEAAARA